MTKLFDIILKRNCVFPHEIKWFYNFRSISLIFLIYFLELKYGLLDTLFLLFIISNNDELSLKRIPKCKFLKFYGHVTNPQLGSISNVSFWYLMWNSEHWLTQIFAFCGFSFFIPEVSQNDLMLTMQDDQLGDTS